VPLALLAWENIRRQYRLDPDRVYVGGFSGGSRVALRIALTYPDVFRGALLEAGSDPIGEPPNSLPPADLFHRFQTSSRLVYLTGGQDAAHLQMDAASRQSLQYWCVFDVATVPMPWLGHELAEPAALGRALDALTQSATVDANRLTQCRAHNETAMTAALAEAETALAHGDRARARSQIATIDTRYAGLATATLLKLEAQLDTKP
jgi:pimeloyl-ACP methyl ester carboxylesterase